MSLEDFIGCWRIKESEISGLPPGTEAVVVGNRKRPRPERRDAVVRPRSESRDAMVRYRNADGLPVRGRFVRADYDAASDRLVGDDCFLYLEDAPIRLTDRRRLVFQKLVAGRPKSESWVAEEDGGGP